MSTRGRKQPIHLKAWELNQVPSKDLQDNVRIWKNVSQGHKKNDSGVIQFKTSAQVSVNRDTNEIFQIYSLLAYWKVDWGLGVIWSYQF